MKMETIKKAIVCLLMAVGFIVILADSEESLMTMVITKLIGLFMFFAGIQLTITWKLFKNLNND